MCERERACIIQTNVPTCRGDCDEVSVSTKHVDFVYERLIQMRKHLQLKRNKAISLPRRKNGEKN